MFITLTTLNAGIAEVVNVREIRRAWVESVLMLVIARSLRSGRRRRSTRYGTREKVRGSQQLPPGRSRRPLR